MGSRYICQMSSRAESERQPAGLNDEWAALGQPLTRIQHGGWPIERGAQKECCIDRLRECDSSRSKHGSFHVHVGVAAWTHGMREDSVGVGHIGAVPGWAGCDGQPPGIGHIAKGRQHDPRLFFRFRHEQLCATAEHCHDRVGQCHCAWDEPGDCGIHISFETKCLRV